MDFLDIFYQRMGEELDKVELVNKERNWSLKSNIDRCRVKLDASKKKWNKSKEIHKKLLGIAYR